MPSTSEVSIAFLRSQAFSAWNLIHHLLCFAGRSRYEMLASQIGKEQSTGDRGKSRCGCFFAVGRFGFGEGEQQRCLPMAEHAEVLLERGPVVCWVLFIVL